MTQNRSMLTAIPTNSDARMQSSIPIVLLTLLMGVMMLPARVSGQQERTADALSVLDGQIDNRRIYNAFLKQGIEIVEQRKKDRSAMDLGLNMEQIAEELVSNRKPANVPLPSFDTPETRSNRQTYQRILKGTLLLGTIYDCGRCDNLHANVAGGVVISESGLALTNYHVLEREEQGVETLLAMTYDGNPHSIKQILSANKAADVALVQLGGDGPFHPVPIARSAPYPTDPVQVLSHPSNQYFVLTTGMVSRSVRLRSRRNYVEWLEITAPFGGGSSGAGIFNQQGELIGLVSRIHPLFRGSSSGPESPADPDDTDSKNSKPKRPPYAEMILRRCVTLESIKGCFKQQ